MVLINLLLIALIVVFIVDISGVIDSLKSGIKWVLTKGKMSNSDYRLKPIDCDLCSVFWSCLIYLIYVGQITIPYLAFVCLLACFSGLLKNSILLIEDIITKIIQLIYKHLIDNEDYNI